MKTKKLEKFTVQRSRWLRGDGDGMLLDPDRGNRMCCLGFACVAAGLTKEQISKRSLPEEAYDEVDAPVIEPLVEETVEGGVLDTSLTTRAAEINDDLGLSDHEREHGLKVLFAEHGVTVRFVP